MALYYLILAVIDVHQPIMLYGSENRRYPVNEGSFIKWIGDVQITHRDLQRKDQEKNADSPPHLVVVVWIIICICKMYFKRKPIRHKPCNRVQHLKSNVRNGDNAAEDEKESGEESTPFINTAAPLLALGIG
eukprot:989583_1